MARARVVQQFLDLGVELLPPQVNRKITALPGLPLFHPKVLEQERKLFAPLHFDEARAILQTWMDADAQGKLDVAETKLDSKFLHDIFGKALGYVGAVDAGNSHWTLDVQSNVSQVGRRAVDGSLGFFQTGHKPQIRAVVELKGANVNLDVAVGRELSPVNQAWDYANRSPGCRWVIVSNYRETRLYSVGQGKEKWHTFYLQNLGDDTEFRNFCAVLSRERLLGADPDALARSEQLLQASDRQLGEITLKVYAEFKELRAALFTDLCQRNGHLPKSRLLRSTQTLLDRVLFVAFAQRRGLLPDGLMDAALDPRSKNQFDLPPLYHNLSVLFRWVDEGRARAGVEGYNGGLFRLNPELDELSVGDDALQRLRKLCSYDFAEEVTVEVLGHIFEQSISDLEHLRAGEDEDATNGKRKKEGVFYTPSWVTRFIARATLGKTIAERAERLQESHFGVMDAREIGHGEWLDYWRDYREMLLSLRVVDPACGSGAFLLAAFDLLAAEYTRINAQLAHYGDETELVDLAEALLHNNLFGVDLNAESVEITRLSLWLKTAMRGKKLSDLDLSIREGNSVVNDATIDERAFDWPSGEPAHEGRRIESPSAEQAAVQSRWQAGFDIVIGNPPYVRQESLPPAQKAHWRGRYATYDGVADLYVYFFEQGLTVCKPGGRLGFIVNNKWLRAGYGEALRAWLVGHAEIEQIVDFGHAPIFPDADTFPCIVVLKKLGVQGHVVAEEVDADGGEGLGRRDRESEGGGEGLDADRGDREIGGEGVLVGPSTAQVERIEPMGGQSDGEIPRQGLPRFVVRVCPVRKADIGHPELEKVVADIGFDVPSDRLQASGWSLEPPAVDALMAKIRDRGVPLREFLGVEPYRGVLTGCNEAFLIDEATRDRLVSEDPRSAELLKPYLRGQDVGRWVAHWDRKYMIFARRGVQIENYPAILAHLTKYRPELEPRPADWDQATAGEWPGRKPGSYAWYEIQDSVAYFELFDGPKILYQEIQFLPHYAWDDKGLYGNNKTFLLSGADHYLLGVLNSPLLWWHNWRWFPHMKDEALSPAGFKMVEVPIADPGPVERDRVGKLVAEVVALAADTATTTIDLLHWLNREHGIDKPGLLLESPAKLSDETFHAELRKRRPKARGALKPAQSREIDEVWREFALPARQRLAKIDRLEAEIAGAVERAYGLTSEDVALMWRTAPPRMPGRQPPGIA